MKQIEILSWGKRRNECGIRLNLLNHVAVFVFDYAIEYKILKTSEQLSIKVEKYGDEIDYQNNSKVIGVDKTRVEKCCITGNRHHIKEFQNCMGFSSIGVNVKEKSSEDLIEAIEDLRRSIEHLYIEIAELNKKTKNPLQK